MWSSAVDTGGVKLFNTLVNVKAKGGDWGYGGERVQFVFRNLVYRRHPL